MSKSAGTPLTLTIDDLERYRVRIVQTSSCSIWMGAIGDDGYGRFWIRQPGGRQRVVTPHRVASELRWGTPTAGSTHVHDCDIRLCCRTDPGHVRVSTQTENMQQAAWRGRANGRRFGRVDTRGPAGQSRAIQQALRIATGTPDQLAEALAEAIRAGDPARDTYRLF